MKIENVHWKKTFKISLIFYTITILLIAVYVSAQSGTTFTISQGVYPGAPSYTIWVEGSTYYAKNAYGTIDYSGTNATEIIQNALDNANSGETILLKGESVFSLDATLILSKNRQKLIGESGTILKQKSNTNLLSMINITSNANTVSNIHFGGNSVNQNNGTIPILITGSRNFISNLYFYNWHTSDSNFPSSAIHVWGGSHNQISNIVVNSLDGGGFAYGSYRNSLSDMIILSPETHGWTITSSQPLNPTSNPADHSTSYGNIVNNVKIYNAQGIGFSIDGDSQFNEVSNIYVEGAVADGINLEGWTGVGAPAHNVLSDLIIRNARFSIASTLYNEITNTTVTNINIETEKTETPIYINYAIETVLTTVNVFGNEVWVNASKRLTITNFHSWYSGANGIKIQNSEDILVSSFTINYAYYSGISSINIVASVYSNGIIRYSGQSGSYKYGIYFDDTDNSVVSLVLCRNGNYGIYLEDTSAYNLIHGNHVNGNTNTIKQGAGAGNIFTDNLPDNGA